MPHVTSMLEIILMTIEVPRCEVNPEQKFHQRDFIKYLPPILIDLIIN